MPDCRLLAGLGAFLVDVERGGQPFATVPEPSQSRGELLERGEVRGQAVELIPRRREDHVNPLVATGKDEEGEGPALRIREVALPGRVTPECRRVLTDQRVARRSRERAHRRSKRIRNLVGRQSGVDIF